MSILPPDDDRVRPERGQPSVVHIEEAYDEARRITRGLCSQNVVGLPLARKEWPASNLQHATNHRSYVIRIILARAADPPSPCSSTFQAKPDELLAFVAIGKSACTPCSLVGSVPLTKNWSCQVRRRRIASCTWRLDIDASHFQALLLLVP